MQIKYTFMLPLAFVLFALGKTTAQSTIVQESEKNMTLGSRPCFHIDFTQANAKLVEELWKDFVKEEFDAKTKKDKKTDQFAALGLESSFISTGKFDLYAKVEEVGKEGASFDVWFDVGANFLNRRDNAAHTDDAIAALKRFYFKVRREVVNQELKVQQDKQKDVEKKMKNLKKDKESLLKDIEDYKAKIKKAEEEIVKNDQDQSKTQLEIDAQKRNVDEVQKKLDNVEKEH